MRPATFSPDDARQFLEHGPNFRRQQAIEANQNHIFYVVDCDLSSILYFAIAQILNLPAYLNEIPGHNFVRWSAGGLHVNWDSNYGDSFPNAMYTEESYIPQRLSGTAYLVDMRPESVMRYWHDLRSKLRTAASLLIPPRDCHPTTTESRKDELTTNGFLVLLAHTGGLHTAGMRRRYIRINSECAKSIILEERTGDFALVEKLIS